jgi:hypothetical protein
MAEVPPYEARARRYNAAHVQRHVHHVETVRRVADERLDEREHVDVAGAPDFVKAVDHVGRRHRDALAEIPHPDAAELVELLVAEEPREGPRRIRGVEQHRDRDQPNHDADRHDRPEPPLLGFRQSAAGRHRRPHQRRQRQDRQRRQRVGEPEQQAGADHDRGPRLTEHRRHGHRRHEASGSSTAS